jgi:hypothetical protein
MDSSSEVSRVVAYLELESDEEKRAMIESFRRSHLAENPQALKKIEQSILDPTKFKMNVSLVAQTSDGQRISTGGSDFSFGGPSSDFSFGGPRRGLGAIWLRYRGPQLSDDPQERDRLLAEAYHVGLPDIEDAINQMLGRDPEQHRPPRLSWDSLLTALAEEGIKVSEQEFIPLPLVIELSPEVKTELGVDQGSRGS